MSQPAIVTAPTVTKLPEGVAGSVLVTGSHGGLYAGMLAARAEVRAVIFHDAGIGMAQAGVASLAVLGKYGVPAAAVSHMSARIGDTGDMLGRGVISRMNQAAEALGVTRAMPCAQAAGLLLAAALRRAVFPEIAEARGVEGRLVLVDSASLVVPEDVGRVIVTGSHGGLIGGDPALALRVAGFAAAFNDAGIGVDGAGIGRLAALEARGIAALTVSAGSARIGEARSTLEGMISAVNSVAAGLGAVVGSPARGVLTKWAGL